MTFLAFVIFCYGSLIAADYNYIAILKHLGMSNPLIVGEKSQLRRQDMFNLMKDVAQLNQTICLTTNIKNDSLLQSPGILFNPSEDVLESLNHSLSYNKKPWIIVSENFNHYSRIDKPIYTLINGTLIEKYKLKSMVKTNKLGVLNEKDFEWNQIHSKHLIERRANFEGVTIFGMTETEFKYVRLPKDFQNIAKMSKDIPSKYEVSNFLFNL